MKYGNVNIFLPTFTHGTNEIKITFFNACQGKKGEEYIKILPVFISLDNNKLSLLFADKTFMIFTVPDIANVKRTKEIFDQE